MSVFFFFYKFMRFLLFFFNMMTHFLRFHNTWSIITKWSIPKLITIVKFWTVRESSNFFFFFLFLGHPQCVSGKKSVCNAIDVALDSWVRQYALEKGMPTHSAFLPRKSHGQKSLAGYSPQCLKRVRHDWATTTPLHKIYEDTYIFIIVCADLEKD